MKAKTLHLLGLMAIAAMTSGCSSMLSPVGSDEFSCEPGKPKATCRTPTAVYRSTHGTAPVAETDAPVAWSKLIRGTSGEVAVDAERQTQSGEYAPRPVNGQARAQMGVPGLNAKTLGLGAVATAGRPVRENAQVMRIWVAPWIDKKDDLHYPSYIFTEVQPRRWTFGVNEFGGRGVVVPHKDFATADPQRSSASAAERAPAGLAKPANPEAVPADGTTPAEIALPN
jgi:conjugal transfer pilus assembly protein TraV